MPLTYQPFLPIGAALAAMAPRPGATIALSEPLLRQSRHVAFEFMSLRENRFGPNSNEVGMEALERTTQGVANFLGTCQGVVPQPTLLEEAKLAEATLREIRALWQGDHFFSEPMKSFFQGFTTLKVDHDRFGEKLFRGLRAYRETRDEAETLFLKPFHEYRDQLMAIVDGVHGRDHFSNFVVESRIKKELLSKLQKREWQDMRKYYDLVGLRILIGKQLEVSAAVTMLKGAFGVHESTAMIEPDTPHHFRIADVEIHVPTGHMDADLVNELTEWDARVKVLVTENPRGYRARHVNVDRYSKPDVLEHATAEIQVMSRGINLWGEKQRLLIYKEDRIPPEVKAVLNGYCWDVAAFIVALENGEVEEQLPDFNSEKLDKLNRIEDETLRSDVLDRLCDMENVMTTLLEEFTEPATTAG